MKEFYQKFAKSHIGQVEGASDSGLVAYRMQNMDMCQMKYLGVHLTIHLVITVIKLKKKYLGENFISPSESIDMPPG